MSVVALSYVLLATQLLFIYLSAKDWWTYRRLIEEFNKQFGICEICGQKGEGTFQSMEQSKTGEIAVRSINLCQKCCAENWNSVIEEAKRHSNHSEEDLC